MDRFQSRCSSILIFLGSISIFCVIPWCSSFFFDYSLLKLGFSLPVDDLRRTVYTDFKNTNFDLLGDKSRIYHDPVAFSDQSSNTSKKLRKLSREKKLEQGLARARKSILRAASARNTTEYKTHFTNVEVYRNPAELYRSYMEMMKRFKVYVYEEGEYPLVHDGPCKDVYAVEGRFIHEMEKGKTRFRTNDPLKAHVYFMPYSVTFLVKYLYEDQNHDASPLRRFVSDYVTTISNKYPFWNRSSGADHFIFACHDWGPLTSDANPVLFNASIRALCNANTSEGFNPQKDVSVPEITLYGGEVNPKLNPSITRASQRRYLAFFAGGVHGPIRPILLEHWKNRHPDMPVQEYLPKHLNFYDFMLQSKFCLCPSGYEVASPRVIESIYAECVPVILSKNFVLPFSDVLRWETFSVQVDVSEIPRLKEILMSVSDEKYRWLRRNLRYVRKHFELNSPPKMFDAFHMILHSIWLRRINFRLS